MYQWRKFSFFDDRGESVPVPDALLGNLTCCSSGRGQCAFGSEDGKIHLFERDLILKFSFSAYPGSISHIQILKQRNYLVSVGEEDTGPDKLSKTYLKLWNLDRTTAETPDKIMPLLIHSLQVFVPKFPESKIKSFLVIEESPPILLIAIGLESGHVHLIRGDVSRSKVLRFTTTADPEVGDSALTPVTGFGYFQEGNVIQLYASTLLYVYVFTLTQNHQSTPIKKMLDVQGCEVNCSCTNNANEFVVGRQEAVYFCLPEGRGPCCIFEGIKKFLFWFRNYLVIISTDKTNKEKNIITFYDIKNKFIAYSADIETVDHYFLEWGVVYLVTKEKKIHCLVEKDMNSKLNFLFKKNLYNIAINIVQSQHADSAATAEVIRKYADYLYSKQEYDESMGQYILTIGKLESSYVIQKFLDAQRIHNLTNYLENLHKENLNEEDHTTLLLNCYTKLKDASKLETFVKEITEKKTSFDVENAVQLCRNAGYYNIALKITKNSKKHKLHIKILLENLAHYDESLEYINQQALNEKVEFINEYGSLLTNHRAEKMTDIILSLCIEDRRKGKEEKVKEKEKERKEGVVKVLSQNDMISPSAPALNALEMNSIGEKGETGGKGGSMREEKKVEGKENEAMDVNALHTNNANSRNENMVINDSINDAKSKSNEKDEDLSFSPLQFAHVYVDCPYWLMIFLERYLQKVSTSAFHSQIHDILLEIYVSDNFNSSSMRNLLKKAYSPYAFPSISSRSFKLDAINDKNNDYYFNYDDYDYASLQSAAKGVTSTVTVKTVEKEREEEKEKEKVKEERREKALSLLKSLWPSNAITPLYDSDQAIVLCQMNEFREGLLFLYERKMLYKEVLYCHMQANDSRGLINACKSMSQSARDVSLWTDVLTFFGSKDEDCSREVKEMLDVLEKENVLPPLHVLQTLSTNPKLTLNVVRDYVCRLVQRENKAIEENRASAEKYQKDTAVMKAEIHDLKTKARIFQLSKCSACTNTLDLPAVHFLCMHSFHLRCLGDNENECPVCLPSNRKIMDMVKNLEQSKDDHDKFFQFMHNSDDGFSVIAEYFGRGVLNRGKREVNK